MNKIFLILGYLSSTSLLYANNSNNIESGEFITKQHALNCIQQNKEMSRASKQMINTETNKTHLKAKINYLQNEIKNRRQFIHKLDQSSDHSNNENYNQLIDQFELLIEEHKDAIKLYNQENQLHISQHNSVKRLEERFSSQCLNNIQIQENLHNVVCAGENIRWCGLFQFQ
ncbi:MAG: hypothetical protein OQK46_00375 [Gammaproteobacteria bacterium]|nr:hypothetical protein [Gammaproteobacteria bacterium]